MEQLDLVDACDRPVARCARHAYTLQPGVWIRSVTVFAARDDGRFWIPTRARHKSLFPGCLDSSVAGHVQAGESYAQAALRETIEETGLSVREEDLWPIAMLSPVQHHTFCFTGVFLLMLRDGASPQLNPQDHDQASWLTLEELLSQILSGTPARSDLPIILRCCRALLEDASAQSLTHLS
jgi:8-oxo-dGTP pyrophosphatase MutT (NUDIX family)